MLYSLFLPFSDFSRWLFSQLFRILSEPKCIEIHGDILKMIDTILVDYRLFFLSLQQLMLCLNESYMAVQAHLI